MNETRLLTMAVAAASSAMVLPAQGAMYLNHQGTGETLIFPFYSTENGNATLINVANVTLDYKRLRFVSSRRRTLRKSSTLTSIYLS